MRIIKSEKYIEKVAGTFQCMGCDSVVDIKEADPLYPFCCRDCVEKIKIEEINNPGSAGAWGRA